MRVKPWLVVIVLLLSPAVETLAQDIKVPFLFSEDEKLDQTEVTEAIPRSTDLQTDPFLNAPMTRLEYMLTQLESHINNQTSLVRREVSEGFESDPREAYGATVSIAGYARYAREIGRIMVGYRIEGLGRPKKPMRITCDKLLAGLKHAAPQVADGYFITTPYLELWLRTITQCTHQLCKNWQRTLSIRLGLTHALRTEM